MGFNSLSINRRNLFLCLSLLFAVSVTGLANMEAFFNIQVSRQDFDEGPTIAARVFAHPEQYEKDALAYNSSAAAMGSIINWGAYAAYRYLNIDPIASHALAVSLQNLLIPLAAFLFALVVSQGQLALSLVSALAFLVFKPWTWNLANYGELLWMPYAGHLAFPMTLLGIAALAAGRWSLSLLFVILTGLVHPSMGCHAAMIWGVFCLFDAKASFKLLCLRLISLVGALVLGLLPTFLVLKTVAFAKDPITEKTLLLGNGHIVPWLQNCLWCQTTFLRNILILLLGGTLAAFYWLRKKNLDSNTPSNIKKAWAATFIAGLLLAAAHMTNNLTLQSISLLKLLGTRGSQFFGPWMIVTAFLFVYEKWSRLRFLHLFIFFLAILQLKFQTPFSEPTFLLYALALAFFVVPFKKEDSPAFSFREVLTAPLVFGGLFYLSRNLMSWSTVSIAGSDLIVNSIHSALAKNSVFALALAIGAYSHRSLQQRGYILGFSLRHCWLNFPLLLILISSHWSKSKDIGGVANTIAMRANYDVQLWAKNNTPPGAVFIHDASISNSFRAFANRPAVGFARIQNPYSLTEKAAAYNAKIEAFGQEMRRAGIAERSTLFWKHFAKQFEAQYLIAKKSEEPHADFRIVHQNDVFVIYEIPRN